MAQFTQFTIKISNTILNYTPQIHVRLSPLCCRFGSRRVRLLSELHGLHEHVQDGDRDGHRVRAFGRRWWQPAASSLFKQWKFPLFFDGNGRSCKIGECPRLRPLPGLRVGGHGSCLQLLDRSGKHLDGGQQTTGFIFY